MTPPPPRTNNGLILKRLLTSLSLCEGKVQSCILANGKRRISGERDGPLSLQRGPSDEPPFLLGNMVGTRGRLGSDSPLLLTRSSLALALAAVLARGVRSLQVSRAPLSHLLTSPHISCLSLSPKLLESRGSKLHAAISRHRFTYLGAVLRQRGIRPQVFSRPALL